MNDLIRQWTVGRQRSKAYGNDQPQTPASTYQSAEKINDRINRIAEIAGIDRQPAQTVYHLIAGQGEALIIKDRKSAVATWKTRETNRRIKSGEPSLQQQPVNESLIGPVPTDYALAKTGQAISKATGVPSTREQATNVFAIAWQFRPTADNE